jgi:hypothetical protein
MLAAGGELCWIVMIDAAAVRVRVHSLRGECYSCRTKPRHSVGAILFFLYLHELILTSIEQDFAAAKISRRRQSVDFAPTEQSTITADRPLVLKALPES